MAKEIVVVFLAVAFSAVQAEIIYPCPRLSHQCISKVLASNSGCDTNVMGFIANQYNVSEFHFETAYFNCSYIDRGLIVRNHDKCRISRFFYNTVTKVAVLGMTCRNLELESDRVLIQHRTFQEDTSYNYHIHATYPLIHITVNLPKSTNMDLCTSHAFTDVVTLPIMHIDPKDYRTSRFLSKDLSLLDIYERENFYYRGFPISFIFISSYICNYGCWPHILSGRDDYERYGRIPFPKPSYPRGRRYTRVGCNH
ncbi:fibrohexamerin isoform X1 [Spodoptera frugiperda]|uniref:Fibrohexamerin isoform X1 n=1 Tax=Spodoptera frugiperda TaxID=7108 RepID=A0A9R0E4R2_SPOFR|nr:fibrohexamerin isoform X1 [Spodoptera frugiperda]